MCDSKPFGLILFVGEGLVSSKIAAARLYESGADYSLALDRMPHLAMLGTHANDLAVSDAAAAASAMATGQKTNQGALSVGPNGQALMTLVELAQKSGRAVGLISTGSVTDPTLAAFYTHDTDHQNHDQYAAELVDRVKPELILAGGSQYFLPDTQPGGERQDNRDLFNEMVGTPKGDKYTLLRSAEDLQNDLSWSTGRVAGFFTYGPFPYRDQPGGKHQHPSLVDMVKRGVEILQRNRSGYLLIVDAALVGQASEKNQGERMLQSIIDLDQAVDMAVRYAGEKTLVVVAGTVSTGGFALNGYPLRQDHSVALLGTTVYGWPSITWATGPKGILTGAVGANVKAAKGSGSSKGGGGSVNTIVGAIPDQPGVFATPNAANIVDESIAFGFGPGSDTLEGFRDNTFVFKVISDQM